MLLPLKCRCVLALNNDDNRVLAASQLRGKIESLISTLAHIVCPAFVNLHVHKTSASANSRYLIIQEKNRLQKSSFEAFPLQNIHV